MGRAVGRAAEAVGRQRVLLAALSPLGVLERGYAIAYGADGRPLRTSRATRIGDSVGVRLASGGFRATITARTEGVPNGDET